MTSPRAKILAAIVVVLVVVLAPSVVGADSLQDQFQSALSRHVAGDLSGAIAGYRRLIDLGVDDAEVYYNLGTAYAETGAYGRALQFLERALRLRPGDEGVRHNLKLARAKLARKHLEEHRDALSEERPPFWRALTDSLTSEAAAVAFALAWGLFFAILVVRRWLVGETVRLASGILLAILGCSTILSGLLLANKSWLDHGAREAIVVADEAVVRRGAGSDFTETHRLSEGARVRVLRDEAGWSLVRDARARDGWVPRGDVGRL